MTDDRREPTEDPPTLAQDSPTELVEDGAGEMVERLSSGTATMLLAWLIGIGAASALLSAWIFSRVVLEQSLGLDALFSGVGLYVSLFGASGPTVLWLAGRAQNRSLGWFAWTAVRMGLLMIAIVIVGGALGALMLGAELRAAQLLVAAVLVAITLLLSVIWALATWSADRYIARARLEAQ